jgi:hypothetical protein
MQHPPDLRPDPESELAGPVLEFRGGELRDDMTMVVLRAGEPPAA